MIEVAMFFGGFVAGMLCTVVCCFIMGDDSNDIPVAVALEADVDSSAVTVYEFENVDEDL